MLTIACTFCLAREADTIDLCAIYKLVWNISSVIDLIHFRLLFLAGNAQIRILSVTNILVMLNLLCEIKLE